MKSTLDTSPRIFLFWYWRSGRREDWQDIFCCCCIKRLPIWSSTNHSIRIILSVIILFIFCIIYTLRIGYFIQAFVLVFHFYFFHYFWSKIFKQNGIIRNQQFYPSRTSQGYRRQPQSYGKFSKLILFHVYSFAMFMLCCAHKHVV